jgi:hypothetical protein
MKALKLLGVGSIKDNELHKNLLLALDSIEHNFKVKVVRNINEIVNHNIRSTPALLIDNQIITQGKPCSCSELIDLLNKFSRSSSNRVT